MILLNLWQHLSPEVRLFIYCGIGSSLVNGIIGRKSQINAWCESHPRVAALLKISRGLGLDPWQLVQAASLFFTKKMPKGLGPKTIVVAVEKGQGDESSTSP